MSAQTLGEGDYESVLTYTFDAVEYLKGSGGSELVVDVPAESGEWWDPHKTEREALMAGEARLESRDTLWDDREGLIFISLKAENGMEASQSGRYYFVGFYRDPSFDFTITSDHSRAWLPSAGSIAGASADGAEGPASSDGLRFLLTAPDQDTSVEEASQAAAGAPSGVGPATAVSVAEVKAVIAETDRLLKEGEGIEGYKTCILGTYRTRRYIEWAKEHDNLNHRFDLNLDSGLPAGTVLEEGESWPYEPGKLPKKWFEGRDKDLFIQELVGREVYPPPYSVSLTTRTLTTRPLPAGEYRAYYSGQVPQDVPCDFDPEELRTAAEMFVTVTAPEGVVHESFFDPVDMGSAVGAGGADGVMKPESFADDSGAATTIQRIEWESGMVEMRLDPQTDLADHHVDFIALDGSVALRLDFDDAVEAGDGGKRTLTWGVCAQPWSAGDMLMLRISQSSPDLTSATNDTACPSAGP